LRAAVRFDAASPARALWRRQPSPPPPQCARAPRAPQVLECLKKAAKEGGDALKAMAPVKEKIKAACNRSNEEDGLSNDTVMAPRRRAARRLRGTAVEARATHL